MKLKKKQREAVLAWVAEGLQTDEINKRAEKFKPRFKVLRSQVDYYRKISKVNLKEIKYSDDMAALTTGLALKENRVETLQRLAELMLTDLFGDKLWLLQVKGIGGTDNYERVEYYEFNSAEVGQLRSVLDDIAAETGGRIKKAEITGKDGEPLQPKAIDHEGFDRAILSLADAIREIVPAKDTKQNGEVEAPK
jgi:hypothetical protein